MIYARIDETGRVAEVIKPVYDEAGAEIDIHLRYHPDFVATLVEVPEGLPVVEGYTYADGVFTPPAPPVIPDEYLAMEARLRRDMELRDVYDTGLSMAQRALRLATTAAAKTYANGKIAELDAYAEALTAVPDQEGFPRTINWPVAPTK